MRSVTLTTGMLIIASALLLSACEKMKMDKNQSKSKALDLSVNLDVQEHNDTGYDQQGRKRELQGLFQPEKERSNVEVEAHFERPHQENKERETTPDGVGVGFKVGI